MPEQIFETVVTTTSPAGAVHIAPMGVRYVGGEVVLMPFKPSTTLDNIVGTGAAVLNLSPGGDLTEAAANLFRMLRALDEDAPAAIAVAPIPARGLGLAINDRLRRAAAGR